MRSISATAAAAIRLGQLKRRLGAAPLPGTPPSDAFGFLANLARSRLHRDVRKITVVSGSGSGVTQGLYPPSMPRPCHARPRKGPHRRRPARTRDTPATPRPGESDAYRFQTVPDDLLMFHPSASAASSIGTAADS